MQSYSDPPDPGGKAPPENKTTAEDHGRQGTPARGKVLAPDPPPTHKSHPPQLQKQLAVYKELLEKYRQLVEYAPAGIYEIDIASIRFTSVNDVMCEYTGYSREEFLQLNPFDLLTEDSQKTFIKRFEDVATGEQELEQVEYEIIGKNKRRFWVLVNSRFFFEDGVPKKVMAVVHDITARRQAEEEKKQLETRLNQAQKLESIDTLAGGIAHDFNNILSIILGNTELALDDIPEWSPARHSLNEIRTASLRAKNVIHQLLSFARRRNLEKKPLNISTIVTETLNLIRSSVQAGIEIRPHIPSDKMTILGDATQISQVMINLCTNADHAMPEGGVLTVKVDKVLLDQEAQVKKYGLKPGHYVKLQVSDTGYGIAAADIEHVFEPYFTTKKVGQGTGMGLSVVHGIVKDHQGTIWVESDPGQGATFNLLFPLVEDQAAEETEAVEGLLGGDEKIFFVDDEPAIADLAKQMLGRLGYGAETQTNPRAALDLFASKPESFDLIITDMAMPDLSGEKLAAAVKRTRPDIPVILFTGYGDKVSAKVAAQAGIKALIHKPLAKMELAQTVRRVLNETAVAKVDKGTV